MLPGSLTLTVDGKSANNLVNLYLVSNVFFDVDLPDDNIFDENCFPAIVVSPNVGWGYHVFLNPLPPGQHTIQWKTADEGADLPFPSPDPPFFHWSGYIRTLPTTSQSSPGGSVCKGRMLLDGRKLEYRLV